MKQFVKNGLKANYIAKHENMEASHWDSYTCKYTWLSMCVAMPVYITCWYALQVVWGEDA